ncbi:hypothetical protein ACFQZ4_04095 [Catellatospora coxensis]
MTAPASSVPAGTSRPSCASRSSVAVSRRCCGAVPRSTSTMDGSSSRARAEAVW